MTIVTHLVINSVGDRPSSTAVSRNVPLLAGTAEAIRVGNHAMTNEQHRLERMKKTRHFRIYVIHYASLFDKPLSGTSLISVEFHPLPGCMCLNRVRDPCK